MLFNEFFLNKIFSSPFVQAASARGIEKFGEVQLFAEHDGKVQRFGKSFNAGPTPQEDASGPPHGQHVLTLQCNDRTDLVMFCAVGMSDSFESVPHAILFQAHNSLSLH